MPVNTTDSYQGQECGVSIIDMVAARICKLGLASVEAGGSGSGYASASAYVKNANRICVALSRGRCGIFIFCQAALLISTWSAKRPSRANIAYLLVEDANDPGLVYNNWSTMDSDPRGVVARRVLSSRQAEDKRGKENTAQLKLNGDRLKQRHAARQHGPMLTLAPEPEPAPAPVHKTLSAMTTRPLGPKEIAAKAGQYDIDSPPQIKGGDKEKIAKHFAAGMGDVMSKISSALAEESEDEEDTEIPDASQPQDKGKGKVREEDIEIADAPSAEST